MRARVVGVLKDRWEVALVGGGPAAPAGSGHTGPRIVQASVSGRLRHAATGPADLPVVGDWVEVGWSGGHSTAVIRAVEPRTGLLARKRPGDVQTDAVVEQAIAANVDVALLAMAVDDDFSLRRLERYLTLAWDAGATPVVVLTKADLAGDRGAPDLDARRDEVATVTFGTRVVATSAVTGEGLAELREVLAPGQCAILLGSSGVGKSTLLNALAGTDLQRIAHVRERDGRGRHTTTARRLVELPWGAYLVDTPGVREVQLWGDEESLAGAFPDIEDLAASCRFRDCGHEHEVGCAVREAVDSGELPGDRLESWRRLGRELAHLERRTNAGAARAERERWKSIAKLQKSLAKQRGR